MHLGHADGDVVEYKGFACFPLFHYHYRQDEKKGHLGPENTFLLLAWRISNSLEDDPQKVLSILSLRCWREHG
jgi:hypothetical protein